MSSQSEYIKLLVGLVLVTGVYVLLRNNYLLGSLVLAGIYTTAIVGLVVLVGLGGQFSLGHAAFVGIGAYITAFFGYHSYPAWVTLPASGIVAAVLAVLVGYPLLRLRGYYLAVATLALGLIVLSVLNGWRSATNGPSGITEILPITIGPLILAGDKANYWIAWIVALISIWAVGNLSTSRLGRAMLAVKHDEIAAAAMGINVHWVKVQVFAVSAALGGVSGALYAHYVAFISPERFNAVASFELLLAALLGGTGTPFGAGLGALLLIALPEIFAPLRDYKPIVYGLVFILVSLYLPHGLAGLYKMVSRAMPRWPSLGKPARSEVKRPR
jgi:branched-chain amino acid transport system permease protein